MNALNDAQAAKRKRLRDLAGTADPVQTQAPVHEVNVGEGVAPGVTETADVAPVLPRSFTDSDVAQAHATIEAAATVLDDTDPRTERERRFDGLLAGLDFSFVERLHDSTTLPRLLDNEGDYMLSIPERLQHAIDLERDVIVLEVLKTLALTHRNALTRGIAIGQEIGATELCRQMHRLLGIDRIIEALADR